jgi:hypothetical protein
VIILAARWFLPPFSSLERRPMTLRVNREIFERVKAAILQTRRIDIYWWTRIEGGREVKPVSGIRSLRLLEDCRTVACIGGWTCALATEEEIARAARAYGLSDLDANEPFTLAAALLLHGGEDVVDVKGLEKASYPLFSLEEWPDLEQAAYCDSRADIERAEIVVRRMEQWAREIEDDITTD